MPTTDIHLKITGLNVHYGQAHALQDVSLELGAGVLAVVGRNGMGKSTLCKAITGMVPASGSVLFNGHELVGMASHAITHRGVAYVPQGRRVWRSLTVDETLQLASKTALQGAWTLERVYQVFPRLAERKNNGGGQLSGGEQQMLAIGRALLFNPRLLVMDEPTEGLAPVIVEQVASLLKRLADERSISVLLIEQNLGVALEVADRVAVMVNGRISTTLPATELAADRALQQRLLGVSSGAADGAVRPDNAPDDAPSANSGRKVMTLVRQHGSSSAASSFASSPSSGSPAMLWQPISTPACEPARGANTVTGKSSTRPLASFEITPRQPARKLQFAHRSSLAGRVAYVVGTFDVEGVALSFLRQCIERTGTRVVTVDLSTSAKNTATTTFSVQDVTQYHPQGPSAVFDADRSESLRSIAVAFEHFAMAQEDMGGIISAGGAEGFALVTRGMQALPVGLPKLVVFADATENISATGTASGITFMHSRTDLPCLNRVNEQVMGNAAHALVGMMKVSPIYKRY
jgi:ABC-type branched-subunit amino acid transport system ATPase component